MKQVNVFQKGISSDNDPSYQPNNTWTFPTNNIRILNKRGQGFIATPMLGTTTDANMEIGFNNLVLTAVEHRGIIYIISVDSNNVTEIGTYPSPVTHSPTNTEFENVYKPLQNYDGGNFSTPLFNYTYTSNLKLIIDDSFDESANLYLCDGVNIDKIVNVGFKRTGESNGITYTDDSFNNVLNHVPTTNSPPIVSDVDVISGGSLKPGNYFIYFKYQTQRFDGTDFLTGTNPIQVGLGSTAYTVRGMADKDYNGEQNRTSSAIKLTFDSSSFDAAYTFLKVAIIRFYSHNSDNQLTDIWQIFQDYKLEDIIDNNDELIITGDETETISSLDNILNENLIERISNDHIFMDGRIWKAGLRRQEFENTPLYAYAQAIIPSFVKTTNIHDRVARSLVLSPSSTYTYGYQDENLTMNELGYFGGEIYPFCVIAQLMDGTFTEGYPITGVDDLFPANANNDKGLYRFPYTNYDEWIFPTFDMSAANAYYLANQADFANIKYIFIARTDKIKNRLYTGLTTKTARAIGGLDITIISQQPIAQKETGFNIPTIWGWNDTTPGQEESAQNGHDLPDGNHYTFNGQNSYTYSVAFTRKATAGPTSPDNDSDIYKDLTKIALFTPDQILRHTDLINDGDELWIRVHGKVELTTNSRWTYKFIDNYELNKQKTAAPPTAFVDVEEVTEVDEEMTALAFPIQKGVYRATNLFTSFMGDGQTQGNRGWRVVPSADNVRYNRSYITSPYIGLEIQTGNDLISQDDMPFERIVTAYKQKNDAQFYLTKIGSYTPESHFYSIISQPLTLAESSIALQVSKGDNFKMRFFTRAVRWLGLDNNAEHNWVGNSYIVGSTEVFPLYEHGCSLGFIADSSVNIAMRNKVEALEGFNYAKYDFFPSQMSSSSYDSWAITSRTSDDAVEAIQINHGYDRILDPKTRIANDPDIPDDDLYKPTKIAFSAKNIIEGIYNNYRYMPTFNQQVFRTDYGEIKRIEETFGSFFSIRDRGIFRHFVGQTKLTENISIQQDSIYLTDQDLPIFYHGLQDWHAIVKTSSAIYGVDRRNMIIWRLVTKYTSTGSRIPQVEALSKIQFIDNELDFIGTQLNPDFTSPVVSNGISAGFNRAYDEVYFSFLNEGYRVAMVFNEKLQGFTGNANIGVAVYINLDDFMYIMPTKFDYKYALYKADSNLSGSIIFDVQYDNQLTIVVNGSGDETSNTRLFTKIYNALIIDSPEKVFKTITYETENETLTYDFTASSSEFWKDSEWAEGKWLVPIITEDGEELRFVWLKITLTFQQGADFYIRKIINDFTISFV